MITCLSSVILLGCVISLNCRTFVINNTHKISKTGHIFPLGIQFKTQYGKRPHGTSAIKKYGASYVQELTEERCRLSKNKVLKDPRMLFVRNVDIEITPDALDNFFHYIYGPLTSKTRLFMDEITGRHKGFGYVTFSTPNIATRVLLTLNGTRLGDKQVFFSDVLYELAKRKPVTEKKIKLSKKRKGIDDYKVPFIPLK
ncbi:hypothetical protein MACK_000379 [Theileria orientalis]|uniref:RRM domain-containing protein n=1 Tax=Theileria orientalis TaxID=68886 RepID=A0A976QT51_THEOR|nr:hypothetical protein MACK_000379 [Theileria orientalis]